MLIGDKDLTCVPKRRHLFELTDLDFCPLWLRSLVTDYLRFLLSAHKVDQAIAPHLARVLRASGATHILDLCSGAAGPLPGILHELKTRENLEPKVLLSDRFPDLQAWEEVSTQCKVQGICLEMIREPVDALSMSGVCQGVPAVRTLFNSLHHFRKEQVDLLLKDALHHGHGVAVFEITERSWRFLFSTLFLPAFVLLATPFIRPLRLFRFVLTYLVPLSPLAIFWDTLVSCLRTYTVFELKQMAMTAAPSGQIEAGVFYIGLLRLPVTYLLVVPSST